MIVHAAGRQTIQILTPEGVVFNLKLAGPFSRFLAWTIDAAVISGATSLIGTGVQLLALISPDFANALFIILYTGFSVGYGIFTEWNWRGQSWGKRLLRLRVIDASGLKLQPSQIVIRNLLRPVDLLPVCYLFGGLFSFASLRRQRLGDLAANTIVVAVPETLALDIQQVRESKYNSFRDYPHLEARLRQLITPVEAALALDAVLRRDEMLPEARVDLFQQIAAHFRSIVPLDDRIDEAVTDEQYVRNAIASLYRQTAPARAATALKMQPD